MREEPPVRVFHLVSTFAVKTDTKWLGQLLSRIDPRRFDSCVACMYGGGAMRDRFEAMGVKTFDLDARRELDPRGLWRLVQLIREIEPQIVHTHLLRADLYGGLAARLTRVPVVLTTQYAIYPYARAVVRAYDGLLDRVCRALATDALAVSEAVRQDLVGRIGWRPERTHTVHTGLDFEQWHPTPDARERIRREWSISADSPVVLTVARLSYEKGLEVLIDAAGLLRQNCPKARFVLVGDGPLRPKLVEQVRRCGLEERVRFVGFHEDIASVLAAGDVFVLPSYMEGMPNAVLEAFAARLPVIASAVGGLVEVIEDGRTGLLVPVCDPAALATAIGRLIREPELAGRLAHAGAEAARQRFGLSVVAGKYEALYSSLITRSR